MTKMSAMRFIWARYLFYGFTVGSLISVIVACDQNFTRPLKAFYYYALEK